MGRLKVGPSLGGPGGALHPELVSGWSTWPLGGEDWYAFLSLVMSTPSVGPDRERYSGLGCSEPFKRGPCKISNSQTEAVVRLSLYLCHGPFHPLDIWLELPNVFFTQPYGKEISCPS